MKVNVTLEIESADELIALGRFFQSGQGQSEAPIEAGAPEPVKAVETAAAPARGRGRPKKDAEHPAPQPAPEPDKPEPADEIETETVDKALVAKELRAFITEKGQDGPKQALGALKEFGANKFDELKAADYSRFLSALKKLR
jgi:hypothetical protein